MRRWERPLLFFSLALNVAFVSLAAVRQVPRNGGDLREGEIETPALPHPDRGRHLGRRWHERRHQALARVLRLDPEQLQRLDAGPGPSRPQLREARLQVFEGRLEYQRALARGDAAAARDAVRALSRAQARVDSLCAEAMLEETSMLRPDQRRRYVRWTFRPGPGPRHGMPPGLVAPLDFGPPPGLAPAPGTAPHPGPGLEAPVPARLEPEPPSPSTGSAAPGR